MKTIELSVDDSIFYGLGEIAKRCHKSRPEVVRESIVARMEYEAWFKQAIAEAREEIKKGNIVSNEDAVRYMDNLINEG